MNKVRAFQGRRYKRLIARMDAKAEEGQWVTTKEGHRIHLSEEGVPDKGNPHVLAAANAPHISDIQDVVKSWNAGKVGKDHSVKIRKALGSLADGTVFRIGKREWTKTTGKTGKPMFMESGKTRSASPEAVASAIYVEVYGKTISAEFGDAESGNDSPKPTKSASSKRAETAKKAEASSGKSGASKTEAPTTASAKATTPAKSTETSAKPVASTKSTSSAGSASTATTGSKTKGTKPTSSSSSKIETSVGKFSKKEMKVLDKLAEEMIGWKFSSLDDEDQDYVFTEAMEKGLL